MICCWLVAVDRPGHFEAHLNPTSTYLGKRQAGNSRALGDKPILNLLVASRSYRRTLLLVVKVLSADHRVTIVARRQPHLRLRARI